MTDDAPRWRRRKMARPGEILEAALSVFAEKGYAAPKLAALADALEASQSPFAQLAPALLARAAGLLSDGRAISIVRMVLAESRNFPDLARIWREDVVEQVLSLVARLIARAQARGEVVA